MTQSQISDRKTKQTLEPSKKQISSSKGSKLHVLALENVPQVQYLVKSSVSYVLQVSSRSQRDQNIQQSQDVSVQSFCNTEADPETHSNTDTNISKKFFKVSHFRDVPELFQRKGEVILSFPIEEIQFQQFCKQLNTKKIFLCRDLLEKELYGK